jgi:ferredoxin
MKVAVDSAKCEGHARCWEICPEVFELDNEGHSVISNPDVPAGLEDKVREAEANCPERAITVS